MTLLDYILRPSHSYHNGEFIFNLSSRLKISRSRKGLFEFNQHLIMFIMC